MAEYNKASDAEKIIQGEVTVKEKSALSRLLNKAGTDADELTKYLIYDVAVPKLKDLLSDVIKKGSDKIIYGKNGVKTASSGNGVTYRYNTISANSNSRTVSNSANSTTVALTQDTTGYNDSSIILASRVDAENVMNSLRGRIAEFGVATISDLYLFIGRNPSFIDRSWGWTNLDSAEIVNVREGWLLKLPKAQSLR